MTTTSITLRRRGVMLIVSSPSGAGKTTISRLLLEREPALTMSVSVTTRPRRPSEISGRDYHFIDRREYDRMVERNEFLEHAEVFGNGYGTPRPAVEKALAEGRDILFDIDWQGTRQMAVSARADMVSVFILPPSFDELERRLRTRAQDSAEAVAKRMAKAADEMSHWEEYDYIIINEDVEHSVIAVQSILTAERHRRDRQLDLAPFVSSLRAVE
ncbi:MAG: guanylate kinase [Pseudomonadota bacterium]